MTVVDVKRAHFHAKATRRIFIELPKEDARHGEGDICGELVMSLYGTRDAAYNWEEAYSTYLQEIGFQRGGASPCHFYDPKTQVRILVHGDDFVAVGPEADVDQWTRKMAAQYPCVSHKIGPNDEHEKELKVIGRHVRLTSQGVEVEVDAKYAEQALEAYGMTGAKSVTSPGAKENDLDNEGRRDLLRRRLLEEGKPMSEKVAEWERPVRGEEVSDEEKVRFRSVAALLNFIGPDRSDMQYPLKEVLRAVSCCAYADHWDLQIRHRRQDKPDVGLSS